MPTRAISDGLGPIYRLADQLDAALALAEDLGARTLTLEPLAAGDSNAAIRARHQRLVAFASSVRALELAVIARVLQARRRGLDVRDLEPRFAGVIGLFVAGTAVLADAAEGMGEGLGDISGAALTIGADVDLFLASRGLGEQGQVGAGALRLAVTEAYPLAGLIQLGPLMDMLARVLDALDLAFDLYAEPRADAAGRSGGRAASGA